MNKADFFFRFAQNSFVTYWYTQHNDALLYFHTQHTTHYSQLSLCSSASRQFTVAACIGVSRDASTGAYLLHFITSATAASSVCDLFLDLM